MSYTRKMAELGWKTGRVRTKIEFEFAENAQKTLFRPNSGTMPGLLEKCTRAPRPRPLSYEPDGSTLFSSLPFMSKQFFP